MMPGRVPCVPDNPLELSWHDSNWIPNLNSSNILDYFSERSNPFYDRTCNNEILKMQRSSPDQLCNMTGTEYILLHVQEPILYVVRKQHRQSPAHTVPVADYYIIAGKVYQAPDLISVINSRLLTSCSHLQSAFDDLFGIMRYQPSKGYTWDIKAQAPVVSTALKNEVKEEPSSNFQRQRVDMLLMELTRRFPVPAPRAPAPEIIENVPEPLQTQTQEPNMTMNIEKTDEIVTVKEERQDQTETSPSMKPPPEKKSRLN